MSAKNHLLSSSAASPPYLPSLLHPSHLEGRVGERKRSTAEGSGSDKWQPLPSAPTPTTSVATTATPSPRIESLLRMVKKASVTSSSSPAVVTPKRSFFFQHHHHHHPQQHQLRVQGAKPSDGTMAGALKSTLRRSSLASLLVGGSSPALHQGAQKQHTLTGSSSPLLPPSSHHHHSHHHHDEPSTSTSVSITSSLPLLMRRQLRRRTTARAAAGTATQLSRRAMKAASALAESARLERERKKKISMLRRLDLEQQEVEAEQLGCSSKDPRSPRFPTTSARASRRKKSSGGSSQRAGELHHHHSTFMRQASERSEGGETGGTALSSEVISLASTTKTSTTTRGAMEERRGDRRGTADCLSLASSGTTRSSCCDLSRDESMISVAGGGGESPPGGEGGGGSSSSRTSSNFGGGGERGVAPTGEEGKTTRSPMERRHFVKARRGGSGHRMRKLGMMEGLPPAFPSSTSIYDDEDNNYSTSAPSSAEAAAAHQYPPSLLQYPQQENNFPNKSSSAGVYRKFSSAARVALRKISHSSLLSSNSAKRSTAAATSCVGMGSLGSNRENNSNYDGTTTMLSIGSSPATSPRSLGSGAGGGMGLGMLGGLSGAPSGSATTTTSAPEFITFGGNATKWREKQQQQQKLSTCSSSNLHPVAMMTALNRRVQKMREEHARTLAARRKTTTASANAASISAMGNDGKKKRPLGHTLSTDSGNRLRRRLDSAGSADSQSSRTLRSRALRLYSLIPDTTKPSWQQLQQSLSQRFSPGAKKQQQQQQKSNSSSARRKNSSSVKKRKKRGKPSTKRKSSHGKSPAHSRFRKHSHECTTRHGSGDSMGGSDRKRPSSSLAYNREDHYLSVAGHGGGQQRAKVDENRLELEKSCLHCYIIGERRRNQLRLELEAAVRALAQQLEENQGLLHLQIGQRARALSQAQAMEQSKQQQSASPSTSLGVDQMSSLEMLRRTMETPDIVVSSFSSDEDNASLYGLIITTAAPAAETDATSAATPGGVTDGPTAQSGSGMEYPSASSPFSPSQMSLGGCGVGVVSSGRNGGGGGGAFGWPTGPTNITSSMFDGGVEAIVSVPISGVSTPDPSLGGISSLYYPTAGSMMMYPYSPSRAGSIASTTALPSPSLMLMDTLKPPPAQLPTPLLKHHHQGSHQSDGSSDMARCSSPPIRSNSVDLSLLRKDIELLSLSSADDNAGGGENNDCDDDDVAFDELLSLTLIQNSPSPGGGDRGTTATHMVGTGATNGGPIPSTPTESIRTVRSRSHDPSSTPDDVLRRPSRIEHLSELFRKALAKSPVVKRAAAMAELGQKRITKHRTSRYWLDERTAPSEHVWLPSSGSGGGGGGGSGGGGGGGGYSGGGGGGAISSGISGVGGSAAGGGAGAIDTECYLGERDCGRGGEKRRCAACHIVAHTECFPLLAKMQLGCKWTFRDFGPTNSSTAAATGYDGGAAVRGGGVTEDSAGCWGGGGGGVMAAPGVAQPPPASKSLLSSFEQNNKLNRHHWIHRWRLEGRCVACAKSFQQKKFQRGEKDVIALTCAWCKRSYHNRRSCFSEALFDAMCDRGQLKELILPPSWLLRLGDRMKRTGGGGAASSLAARRARRRYRPFIVKAMPPPGQSSETTAVMGGPVDIQPLLVFVNPKSGGNKGAKTLHQLCWLLNPRQVFDIMTMGGPRYGLEIFRKIPGKLRILIAGGDGTVGWVLSTLDTLNWSLYPPMAVLPLGTGNDLSRCLGWGGVTPDESLGELLSAINSECSITYLDRWLLDVSPSIPLAGNTEDIENAAAPTSSETASAAATAQSSLPLTVMNNYFSIGADAHVALQFHQSRSAKPQMLNSRLKNRIAYGGLGTIDLFKRAWRDLSDFIMVECDGIDITTRIKESKFHCILFLNIPYYAGGTTPWGGSSHHHHHHHTPVTDAIGLIDSSPVTATPPPPVANTPVEFTRPSCCDGKIEVLGFTTATLATLQMGGRGERIAQCTRVRVETSKAIPMQVDGEPCMLGPSVIKLSFHSRVPMLRREKRHTTASSAPLSPAAISLTSIPPSVAQKVSTTSIPAAVVSTTPTNFADPDDNAGCDDGGSGGGGVRSNCAAPSSTPQHHRHRQIQQQPATTHNNDGDTAVEQQQKERRQEGRRNQVEKRLEPQLPLRNSATENRDSAAAAAADSSDNNHHQRQSSRISDTLRILFSSNAPETYL